ncbi:hypothetical protein TSUD_322450 [Trifolium subterraneum]|uniref:Reverse transcriptase zinc-binding domain-containing protein n=1 Tax=Trifolium subterraneum TaxID=3900 RepID=A0A2Z6N180_TRISU|nr:hypothetical protein TSUD_322450 [Trifolium subterraneum]
MIGRSKKAIFSYIKDRIWKKMNSWRGKTMLKAGKEVMIKSVHQAIPSYVMSIFILPSLFIDALNLAMVAKQAWNIIQNPESLVAKLIKARLELVTRFVLCMTRGCERLVSVGCHHLKGQEEQNGCYSVKSGYNLAMRCIIRSDKHHEAEDVMHLFFGCAAARECWSSAGLSQILQNAVYQHGTVVDRVLEMCRNEDNTTIGRVTSLCWCIWHDRNDKIWNDNIQSQSQVGRMAFAVWNEWFTVHQLQCHNVGPVGDPMPVQWEKP